MYISVYIETTLANRPNNTEVRENEDTDHETH